MNKNNEKQRIITYIDEAKATPTIKSYKLSLNNILVAELNPNYMNGEQDV